jgi:septal ring factor EnvC (AmiA/AmiB activator)
MRPSWSKEGTMSTTLQGPSESRTNGVAYIPALPNPPRRPIAVPILAVTLAIVVILLAVAAFAYLAERGDLQATRSDYVRSQSDLSDTNNRLTSTKTELRATQNGLNGAQADLAIAKSKLTKTRNRLAAAIRAEGNLASYGVATTDLLQKKADCLNIVLDAYNQYSFYVDVGMALERALHSSTCIAAGITFP